MLAIVFWSTPKQNASLRQYEACLAEFHKTLNENRPSGFRYSNCHRTESLPWFESTRCIFEDWYVLSNFAAIDALDTAVVTTGSQNAHAELMTVTGAASGTILALSNGVVKATQTYRVTWLRKPGNMEAEDLVRTVNERLPHQKCSLWTRSLGLGPIENCLLTSGRIDLEPQYRAIAVERDPLWPPS